MMGLILLALISLNSFAGEWWSTPRSEDQEYLYYVGVSEGKVGLGRLQDKAFNKAMSELIREHFGMSIQINESSVEELQKEAFQVVTKQSSAPLFIKGIGLIKTYEKELDVGSRVYVQIRVNKKYLQEAIQNQIANPSEGPLNTFGESNETKVDIKVKTHPQGALIHFTHLGRNFSLQGQGDAKFYLPRGKYQMVVSSPGFTTVKKEIDLMTDGREENIILEELFGHVDLEASPEDARIEYEGNVIKPGELKLRVGKTHKFIVSHEDYFTREVEFVLHHPETVSRTIELDPRPSIIPLDVIPSHAHVEVNGESVTIYDGKIRLSPSVKKFKVSASGYFPYEEVIEVRANQKQPLRIIQLKYDDAEVPVSSKGYSVRFEYNPLVSYEKVGYGMLAPIAFHFEYYYISLGVGYNGSYYEKEDKKSLETYEVQTEDIYGTLRLISPKMGAFKVFASGTYGQYHRKAKGEYVETLWRRTKNYQGLGGGIRAYISPSWSMHAEYFKIDTINLQTEIKEKEDRVIAGFSYEF